MGEDDSSVAAVDCNAGLFTEIVSLCNNITAFGVVPADDIPIIVGSVIGAVLTIFVMICIIIIVILVKKYRHRLPFSRDMEMINIHHDSNDYVKSKGTFTLQ